MSTFMAKAQEIERKWYILDAEGKSLGRVAAVAADLLRGKNEPIFTPHVDCGNHVIVINADKAVQYKTLMATKPEKAMELAVKGMVPDTTIGRKALTRLRIYKGTEHKHEAQKPVVYEF